MNLYKLMKMAVGHGLPQPVKLAGLAMLYRLRRRTAGVFLDPVLACNLRCRMCYFSDPVKRASMKGFMSDSQLDDRAKALFPYALKLQIGCGAEPTLYPRLEEIITLGRQYGVPYISLTSNGQLIGSGKCPLEPLVRAGLNELTLSLHGTTREVYENLMPGADFDTFGRLTTEIARVKRLFPEFKLRVNYTVNSLNVLDLKDDRFWNLWHEDGMPDIVQLRPVQKIGESNWQDFDPQLLERIYNDDSKERPFEHHIYGYDIDASAIAAASANVKAAGLTNDITLAVQPIQKFTQPAQKSIIVTNPPYGERISSPNLLGLYHTLGERLKHQFVGGDAWIIGFREETFAQIGLKPSLKISLYNGSLNCLFNKYTIFSGQLDKYRAEGGELKTDEERQRNAQRKRLKPHRDYKPQRDDRDDIDSEIPDYILRRHRQFVSNEQRQARKARYNDYDSSDNHGSDSDQAPRHSSGPRHSDRGYSPAHDSHRNFDKGGGKKYGSYKDRKDFKPNKGGRHFD